MSDREVVVDGFRMGDWRLFCRDGHPVIATNEEICPVCKKGCGDPPCLRESRQENEALKATGWNVWCLWCMEVVSDKKPDDPMEIVELSKRHDASCPKNPLGLALSEARKALEEIQKKAGAYCLVPWSGGVTDYNCGGIGVCITQLLSTPQGG